MLVAANLLALAAATTMGALRRTQPLLRKATLGDYGGGAVAAAPSLVAGSLALLMSDVDWRGVAGRARSDKAAAVARGRRLFRALAAVLLALLFVVIGSALQRLRLYVDEYGLTASRDSTSRRNCLRCDRDPGRRAGAVPKPALRRGRVHLPAG